MNIDKRRFAWAGGSRSLLRSVLLWRWEFVSEPEARALVVAIRPIHRIPLLQVPEDLHGTSSSRRSAPTRPFVTRTVAERLVT
jgi:hypothetical protein